MAKKKKDALYTYDQDEMEDDIARGDSIHTKKKEFLIVENMEDGLPDLDDDDDDLPLSEEEETPAEEETKEPEEEAPEVEVEEPIERTPEEFAEEEANLIKVKVDGEEAEVTQEELITGYQKAKASEQRFQAAAEMEKKAKGVLGQFLNPEDAIGTLQDLYAEHYDGDYTKARDMVDKIVGTRVEALMEYESLSPEEKKIKQLEEDKARMEERLLKRETQEEAQTEQERVVAANAEAVPILDEAIKKFDLEIGSPEDTEASESLAQMVRQGTVVTQELADQVVAGVVAKKQDQLQAAVSGLSAEELLAANPQLAEELRGKSIDDIKRSRATQAAEPSPAPTKKRRTEPEVIERGSSNDFFSETDW